ncbi:Rieske [2Fe-2S] domain protein [compost metagenome]
MKEMNRRDFLKCSGKACGALGLGLLLGSNLLQSCASGLSVMRVSAEEGFVSLPLAQLDQSAYTMIRVKNFPFDIGVQKTTDGTYQALVLMCPHANQPLTKTGSGYMCTMHGSKFAKDGALLKGPSAKPMTSLPVETKGDLLLIRTAAFHS